MDTQENQTTPVILDYSVPPKKVRSRYSFLRITCGLIIGLVAAITLGNFLAHRAFNPIDFIPIVLVLHLGAGVMMILTSHVREYGIGFLLAIPVLFTIAISAPEWIRYFLR